MKKKLEVKIAPDWDILINRWNSASAAHGASLAALEAAFKAGKDTSEFEADEKTASAELRQIKTEIDALIGERSAARRPGPDSLIIAFMDDDPADKAMSEDKEKGKAHSQGKTSPHAASVSGKKLHR
ncbi:MAG: hypothetical protein WCC66_01970 [Rhizobiaceae bacterium]